MDDIITSSHEIHQNQPALYNEYVQFICNSSKEDDLFINFIKKPFKWSEKIGYFFKKYESGFSGLGSGIIQPVLYHPNIDFPEEIIKRKANVLLNL